MRKLLEWFLSLLKGTSHTIPATQQETELEELVGSLRDTISETLGRSDEINPKRYNRIHVSSDVVCIGVPIECLGQLYNAMSSLGDDSYIDVPVFNNGFCNTSPMRLDEFLTDTNGNWVMLDDSLVKLRASIDAVEDAMDNLKRPELKEYYEGHFKRVLVRTLKVLKQI